MALAQHARGSQNIRTSFLVIDWIREHSIFALKLSERAAGDRTFFVEQNCKLYNQSAQDDAEMKTVRTIFLVLLSGSHLWSRTRRRMRRERHRHQIKASKKASTHTHTLCSHSLDYSHRFVSVALREKCMHLYMFCQPCRPWV